MIYIYLIITVLLFGIILWLQAKHQLGAGRLAFGLSVLVCLSLMMLYREWFGHDEFTWLWIISGLVLGCLLFARLYGYNRHT